MDNIDKAKRTQYINALKAASDMRASVGLPIEGSGLRSEDQSDPTVYSSRSGGRGFNNLIMNNIQKVYTPEQIEQDSIKNAQEEMLRKRAIEELIKEGKLNLFDDQV